MHSRSASPALPPAADRQAALNAAPHAAWCHENPAPSWHDPRLAPCRLVAQAPTFCSTSRPLLMLIASRMRAPSALVRLQRSLPARSTMCSLLVYVTPASRTGRRDSTSVNTECAREERRLRLVVPGVTGGGARGGSPGGCASTNQALRVAAAARSPPPFNPAPACPCACMFPGALWAAHPRRGSGSRAGTSPGRAPRHARRC